MTGRLDRDRHIHPGSSLRHAEGKPEDGYPPAFASDGTGSGTIACRLRMRPMSR